jgi:pyruvate formate lyase activating enzyme
MTSLTKIYNDRLECQLCPHYCKLSAGKTGICGVRKNTGNNIELTTYGVISGYSLDPIEKKPLYHFYPGYKILSVGSYGCNMRCDFCQNYHISQNVPVSMQPELTIDGIIKDCLKAENNIGLAFTYNEPIISFEFIRDAAAKAKEKGLKTVMVSNGYVNPAPLKEIIGFIDAFNIDLKAFNEVFYKKVTGSEMEPVKKTLKQISESGRHLEVTTLVIPGMNDDENGMRLQTEWMAGELGRNVPFHLSAYFPRYKRESPATSDDILVRLSDIASEKLDYVYTGNTGLSLKQSTHCKECSTLVTIRSGYKTTTLNLNENGTCAVCGNLIYSNFIF